jgi:hypothetical protein
MSTPTSSSTFSASLADRSPTPPSDPADKIGGEKAKGTLTDWLQAELKKTIRHLQFLETTANLAWWWCTLLLVLGTAIALDHWLWALPTFARYLFWLTGISLSVFWLLRRMLPLFVFRIHPLYAAKVVEEALPELKNRLISWWELKHEPQAAPRGVVAAVGRQAVAHLRTHDSSALLDTRPMIVSLSIALGLTVFISLYSLVAPRSAWTTAERIMFPWMSIAPPARVQILQVQPGSSIIPQSLPCPIGAEVSGLLSDEKVFVRFTSADRQILDQRLELNAKLAGSSYEGLLTTDGRGMQQDVEYWVEAGDAVAGPYSLQVNPLPQLSINKVRLIYPAYTKLPPTEQNSDGNLDAVEGTRVELTTTLTGNAQKTFVEFFSLSPDNKPQRSLRVEPLTLSGNTGTTAFTVRLNSQRQNPTQETYTLRAIDRTGHSEPNPLFYPIRVTGDFAPEVRLTSNSDSPLKTSPRSSVTVQLNALDPDFGLSSVELEVRKGNFVLETLSLLDNPEGFREPWNKKFQIRVAKWRLSSGDRITLTAIAKDNRKQPGTEAPEPNVVRSNSLEIEITDPPEPEKNNSSDTPEEKDAPAVEEMTDDENSEENSRPKNQSGQEKQSSKSSENGKNSQPGNSGSGTSSEGGSPSEPQNPDNNSGGSSSSDPSSTKSQSTSGGDSGNSDSSEAAKPNSDSPSPDSSSAENNNTSPSEKNNTQQSNPPNSSGSRSEKNQNPSSKPNSDSAQSPPPEHDGDIMERIQQRLNQQQNKNGNSPSQAKNNSRQSPSQSENQNPENNSEAPSENNSNAMNAADSPRTSDSNSEPNAQPRNPDNQNPGAQNGEKPSQGDNNAGDKKAGDKSGNKDSDNSNSGNKNSGDKNGDQDKGDAENAGQPQTNPDDARGQNGPENQSSNPNSNPNSGQSKSSEPKSGQRSPREPGAKPEDRAGDNANNNTPPTSDPSSNTPTKNQTQKGDENRPNKNGNSENGNSTKGNSEQGNSEQGNSEKDASEKDASEKDASEKDASEKDASEKTGMKQGNGNQGNQQEGSRGNEGNGKEEQGTNNPQPNSDPQSGDQKGNNQQSGKEQGQAQEGANPKENRPKENQSGESSQNAGQPQPAGQASNQGKPNNVGSEGGADQNALSSGDASESKGGQPGQKPGNQANPASKPSSAKGEPNGSMPGDNSQGTTANEGADAANLDYAKEATNLALEYLERQKDQPDPELLKEMNWTKEDLNRFLERWKKTLESVDKQGSNRELAEQDLRSLGLRPPKSKATGVRGDEDQFRNLQDGGPRVTPPKSLKSQFESVKKALQQRQSSPSTPAQK